MYIKIEFTTDLTIKNSFWSIVKYIFFSLTKEKLAV